MSTNHLNEHDANQGAQSSGEFLGMTGNSGWFLLGSGGVTIMMVILLWGILGVSLLFCLFIGLVLCLGSLAYVFTLKNNRPEHYDTDFFESALVEAGVLRFGFGPRLRRPLNPFADEGEDPAWRSAGEQRSAGRSTSLSTSRRTRPTSPVAAATNAAESETSAPNAKPEPMVTQAALERLQDKLANTEEQLEDALSEPAED